jgi:hypothetical protein
MHEIRVCLLTIGSITMCLLALGAGQAVLAAEEQGAGEAAGAGRL